MLQDLVLDAEPAGGTLSVVAVLDALERSLEGLHLIVLCGGGVRITGGVVLVPELVQQGLAAVDQKVLEVGSRSSIQDVLAGMVTRSAPSLVGVSRSCRAGTSGLNRFFGGWGCLARCSGPASRRSTAPWGGVVIVRRREGSCQTPFFFAVAPANRQAKSFRLRCVGGDVAGGRPAVDVRGWVTARWRAQGPTQGSKIAAGRWLAWTRFVSVSRRRVGGLCPRAGGCIAARGRAAAAATEDGGVSLSAIAPSAGTVRRPDARGARDR